MRSVALPGVSSPTGSQLSVLGFGCAALLGRASRRESMLALNTAFDAGITFYDTARSYGYGASEGMLGGFLAGGGSSRRSQVVLSTKFGILPVARNWKQMMKPMARAAIRLVPSLREAAQRHANGQFNTNQFSLAHLQSSLETSLRQLRTEYVDVLFLHEPPISVLAQGDLFEALTRLVEQGKVLKVGVAGTQDVTQAVFKKRPACVTAAQFALNLSNMAFADAVAKEKDLLLLANHPFAGSAGVAGTKERLAKLATNAALDAGLREKLAADDPAVLPELIFGLVLNGTGVSSVISAMMAPAHIHANVRAVEHCRFSASELAAVRAVLN